jgi:hypothetical protein
MSVSRKKAIYEKCKDCIYDPYEKGTALKQIENCGIDTCPLWRVRPVTIARKNAENALKNEQRT